MDQIIVTSPKQLQDIVEESVQRIVASWAPQVIARHKSVLHMDDAITMLTNEGYRVTKASLYAMTHRKQIPFRKFGASVVFERDELLEWARNRGAKQVGISATEFISKQARKKDQAIKN